MSSTHDNNESGSETQILPSGPSPLFAPPVRKTKKPAKRIAMLALLFQAIPIVALAFMTLDHSIGEIWNFLSGLTPTLTFYVLGTVATIEALVIRSAVDANTKKRRPLIPIILVSISVGQALLLAQAI